MTEPFDEELTLDPPFGPPPAGTTIPPDEPPTPHKRPWWTSNNAMLTLKCVGITVLAIVLDGAIGLVGDLVLEREQRSMMVQQEISDLWGNPQTLSAPVLAIPFGEAGARPGIEHARRTGVAYVLADEVNFKVTVEPEVRRRGIFETVVYTAAVEVSGTLAPDVLASIRVAAPDLGTAAVVFWPQAHLVVGVSDPKGLRSVGASTLDGRSLEVAPAASDEAWPDAGINLPLHLDAAPEPGTMFSVKLTVNGSRRLAFVPNARQTHVALRTAWPHPGFDGAYLPVSYDTGESGTTANWSVAEFGRGYGQALQASALSDATQRLIGASAFGVQLVQPVTTYRRADRAIKYGVLFLLFTFTFVFVVEVLSGASVHVIQYATLGAPLIVFFALLLALAEHVGFAAAYIIGAGAILAQVGWYLRQLFPTGHRALLGLALLAGQYAFLYTLLEMESYSLLSGAIGMWLLVSVFMVVTRRVRWNRVQDSDTSSLSPQGDTQ
jgi:inner membrane protein